MTTHIPVIQEKLNAFRKKYYLNQVFRGTVILTLLLSSLWVAFAVTEGVFWFSTTLRTWMFVAFAGGGLAVLLLLIVWPLMQYWQLGKTISDEAAAVLIGKYFPDIDDKLLNYLQLSKLDAQSNALLVAAIESKTEQFRPIPFTAAVTFRPNRRLARYIGIPIAIALLLWFLFPEVVTTGTYRFFNFSRHFTPPAPFDIAVPNHKNELVDGENHTVQIEVMGRQLPAELFLYQRDKAGNNFTKFVLDKKSINKYEFTFKSVHKDFEYFIGNDLHRSEILDVAVLQRPSIRNFFVVLTPPAYTGLTAETLATNVGDFQALAGTKAQWHFFFKGPVQQAFFIGSDTAQVETKNNESVSVYSKNIFRNESYAILLKTDRQVANLDTVKYHIETIADRFPAVTIQSPTSQSILPNTGIINLSADFTDDFGFTRAELHYRFLKSDDAKKVSQDYQLIPLKLPIGRNAVNLNEKIDFFQHQAAPGDEIEYFIKVFDNDFVTGPKSAVSLTHKLTYLSTESKYDQLEAENKNIESEINNSVNEAKELNKQFEEMQKKFLEKKQLSYEDKKQIESLIKKQQELSKKSEQISEQLKKNLELSKENNLFTKETLEKMQQLQKLMDEIRNPALEEFLKKLQQQMENLNKEDIQRQMENLQKNAEDINQNLERTLELLKQLKVDQKVEEILQRVENLKERQQLLQENMKNASKDEMKKIEDRQQQLRQDMKDIQKQLEELRELKNQTRTPDKEKMDQLDQKAKDAQQKMDKAQQNLQQQNKKQAEKDQKDAQKEMEELQQMLEKMQRESNEKEDMENYEDLRNLLENLLKLSIDQEALRDQTRPLRYNDPAVNQKAQQQRKLRDDMRMINDSLIALSKRVFEIKKFVTDELKKVNSAMDRAVQHLGEKQIQIATAEQHQIMTGANTLANMLVESLNDMQQQMKDQKSGKKGGACKKPGAGMNLQQLSKEQMMLNQQLQEMLKNGIKDGNMLSEMAARQEAIRKKLQEAMEKLKKEGKQGLGSSEKIQEGMKESEEELKRRQLTQELMMRQQQILSRMLDFDKSVRERDMDNQRESKSGTEKPIISPAELTTEELKKQIRKEQFNSSKYIYTPTFQQLIDSYFKLLESK
jgi:hypothetical protein